MFRLAKASSREVTLATKFFFSKGSVLSVIYYLNHSFITMFVIPSEVFFFFKFTINLMKLTQRSNLSAVGEMNLRNVFSMIDINHDHSVSRFKNF